MGASLNHPNLAGYLLSLPERVLRSASALAGGLAREIGALTLPAALRRTKLYRVLVDTTLRFLIEELGQVEGVYPPEGQLTSNFLVQRAASHGIDLIGILTFQASPVWVLAALADVSGAGRQLIREIADSLQQDGLLEDGAAFETVDQVLNGLERGAGRLADAVNLPPVDVASLRKEWAALQEEVRRFPAVRLPTADSLRLQWEQLRAGAAAQDRSIFQISSLVALGAVSRLPANLLWLSRCAQNATLRTGQVLAEGLLDHYAATLGEIRNAGYFAYWTREFRPYLRAAALQFSPGRDSLTARLLRQALSPPGRPGPPPPPA